MSDLPVLLNAIRASLAKAEDIGEVKGLRDKAEALRKYAAQAGHGLEMQNRAAEVKLWAERRAGELIPNEFPHGGDRKSSSTNSNLKSVGISPYQSSHWRAIARLSEEKFVSEIEYAKGHKEELTSARLYRLARKEMRPSDNGAPPLPKGKFRLIYADPPWRYEHTRTVVRAIENQYPTIPWEEIRDYKDSEGRDIADISAEDCVLFLWATSPKLEEAMSVLKGWGFEYRTNMVWVKDRIGMGSWARQQHELLLIGRCGQPKPPRPENLHSSVIQAPRGPHSVKPSIVYDIIETMYPEYGEKDRVELFAREKRNGWSVWGNAEGL